MDEQASTNFAIQYQRELEKKTLRTGILSAIIGVIGSCAFYYLDLVDLGLEGTFPWRLIGVLGGTIFLISRLFKRLRSYVISLHALAMMGYLIMMAGIGYIIFSDAGVSQKHLFAITSGFITVWFILSLIAQGAREIMVYTGTALVIVSTLVYVFTASSLEDNSGYIFSVFMIGVFAVFTMRNQARYEYDRAFNMFMLQESRDQISQQAEDLQEKNDNLVMFSRAMSHDLQGPLRRVRSFLDLYEFRSKDQLPADTQEYLDLARQHLGQGQKVVHDLLIYAKIGQNELVRTDVDFDQLSHQIVEEQLPLLQDQVTVEVSYDIDTTIRADEKLLWYLMSNLVSNAIKFSSKQSKPHVQITATATDTETILSVQDNGIGFDEEFQKELGRPFKRLHGTEYAGTGIGLSIVSQIMKMHEGRFWAESPVNEGANFYCAFPI